MPQPRGAIGGTEQPTTPTRMNAMERKTTVRVFTTCTAFVLGASAAGAASTEIVPGPDSTNALTLTKTAEYSFAKNGCGGIAWSGRAGVFYVLRDHDDDSDRKSKVYPVSLAIDTATGAIAEQSIGPEFTPGSLRDAEGIARDPQTGNLWISDENTPTIAEYSLTGVATGRAAPVSAVQRNSKQPNLSLEALTVSPDGLTMWTANEEALMCDGEKAKGNPAVSTVVRLTRFTRATPQDDWAADGEWAYVCDSTKAYGISKIDQFAQSGLSGLCALPDGSLLALERETSVSTWGRCRIYRITTGALAAATEVSDFSALTNATFDAVAKGAALVNFHGADYEHMIVYEGIALGPILNDGSRAVYLVSDGGATASAGGLITAVTVPRLCALKLTGLPDDGGPTVPPFLDWPADPDTQITDAVRPEDLGLVAGAFAGASTTTADLRKLSKWASANGVRYAGADVNAMAFDAGGNPETAHSTAYLFNCSVGALDAAKAAFRFTEFTPGTVPSIDATGLNGRVTVLGTDALGGAWAPATSEHHFFQAILTR